MIENVARLSEEFLAAAWELLDAATWGSAEAVDGVLADVLAVLDQHRDRLSGLRLRLLHEARVCGAVSTLDQAGASPRTTTGQARATARLAEEVTTRFPLIGQALAEGALSQQQAEAIVCGLKHLPGAVSGAEVAACQGEVLDYAQELGPRELRILASRLAELLDPDGAEQAEAARLAREEQRAQIDRFVRLQPNHHGGVRLSGLLPVAEAGLLQAQLDALQPSSASYEGRAVTCDQRRADALVRLCHLAAGAEDMPAHGGGRPVVQVTMSLAQLQHASAGTTDLGQAELIGPMPGQVSAGQARRLACDAQVIPVVLGGASEPLDVGRASRFVTQPIRVALTLRDLGCAFPHCQAPPAACEAHHITPWWDGGATALTNLVLLCPYHHRLVEPDPLLTPEQQWGIRLDQDTTRAWFIPPRDVDPAQRPRRHMRYTLTDAAAQQPPPPSDGAGHGDVREKPAPGGGSGSVPSLLEIAMNKPNPWHPEPQAA